MVAYLKKPCALPIGERRSYNSVGEGRGQDAVEWYGNHCSKSSRNPGMVVRDVKGSNAPIGCKRGAVSLGALFSLLRSETFLKSESCTGNQGTSVRLQTAWSQVSRLPDSFS